MRVSQKSDYAFRAMLELAIRSNQKQPVRSAEIARNRQIPEKFLEMILVELRRSGLIISQRGPVGGHRLARTPNEITVGDIWRAIDGTFAETSNAPSTDPLSFVWREVDRGISKVVDRITLADIQKRAESQEGAPDFSI